MKYYRDYYENNFEELITYYPRYYRDVVEMVAVLKAHGGVLDTLEANIEQTYQNNFIEFADEATIKEWEDFLGTSLSGTLDERRNNIVALINSNSIHSIDDVVRMIEKYSSTHVSGKLIIDDEEGNNVLIIEGDGNPLYFSDFELVLKRIEDVLPAHIEWRLEGVSEHNASTVEYMAGTMTCCEMVTLN